MVDINELLARRLLQERPRGQDSSQIMALRLQQPTGPLPDAGSVWAHALTQGINGFRTAWGERNAERRADEREERNFDRLRGIQRQQQEEAAAFFGGGAAQPAPAAMPQMTPMPNAAPMAGGDDPRAMPGYDPMAGSRARLAAMPQGPQELPGGYRAPAGVDGVFEGLAPPTGTLANLSGMPAAPGAVPGSALPAPGTLSGLPPGVTMDMIARGLAHSNPAIRQQAQAMVQVAQLARRETPTPVTVSPGATLVDPQTGRPIFTAPERAERPTEMERRMDLMAQNGVSPETARGLTSGQLVLRQNEQDGTLQLVDIGTGQVRLLGAGGGQPTPQAGQGTPSGRPPLPGQETSIMPTDGAAYREAMGAPGLVAESANMIADLFGGRLPAPQVNTAAQALRNLDTRTRMFLQSAIPGRPSNYLMEMIGGMTLSPSTITQGPERAAERADQTTRFLEQTVRELEEIAAGQGTGRFTRQDIGEANRVLVSLRPLLADYRMLASALASRAPQQRQAPRGTNPMRQQGAAPAAPEGVDPRVWGAMTPEERALWQN